MPDTNPVPTLIEMMFGESAHVSMKTGSERLLTWAADFDEWLETRKTSQSKYNDSRRAWKQLLARVRKLPWDMTRADIEGYQAWLDERGLSPSTVYPLIAYINMFYRWCSRKATDPLPGPSFNPAAGVSHPEAHI
jgi:site-specific recombinase XerD